MNYILFDDRRSSLLPFTYTKPCAELRMGTLSFKERWEMVLNASISYLTEHYLQGKFPVEYNIDNLYINGTIFPSDELINAFNSLEDGQLLYQQEQEKILGFKSSQSVQLNELEQHEFSQVSFNEEVLDINNVWDLFAKNDKAIAYDYELLTKNKTSQVIDSSNRVFGTDLFLEEGAIVRGAILNAETGPIYIGKGAEVMEGSVIRGPFSLGDHATVKLATKIYGATTVGPYSKVGGEVNNSVISGYSNKGHDGFLGNSVLGEWCNLGADTNVSNLKNNYAEVKIWNFEKKGFKSTQLQFCGLMMGDHSKSGINTMFNTGTVVGVSANIYGGGFPRNFIPSFAWGGSESWMVYRTDKAIEVAQKVMERRGISFTSEDQSIFEEVFRQTAAYRNF